MMLTVCMYYASVLPASIIAICSGINDTENNYLLGKGGYVFGSVG